MMFLLFEVGRVVALGRGRRLASFRRHERVPSGHVRVVLCRPPAGA